MPGRDGTRPVGLGVRSGPSAGDSAGRAVLAYLNLVQRLGFWGWGRGPGRGREKGRGGGRRAGKGRGPGRGTGRGRGMTQARASEQELGAIHENASQMQAGARPRSSLVAVVDTARCTGCGACAVMCPMGAIAVDAAASIETSRCAGCGLCVDECPQEAITLKRI
jgi:ferredoxin